MWYFPKVNASVCTGMVWVMVVCGTGSAVLLYYMIERTQNAILFSFNLPSHTFTHILGSFLGQTLETIPWLSAGKVRFCLSKEHVKIPL